MFLSDRDIYALQMVHNVFSEFYPEVVREVDGRRVVSFGLGSTGYDLRLGNEFWVPDYVGGVADPHVKDLEVTTVVRNRSFLLLPGTYVLAHTMERVKMPPHVTGLAFGKSTYARLGIVANVTPFEPGWEGTPTVSLANVGRHPVALAVGEGIIQLVMFAAENPPDVTYADRDGKYQGQTGITPGMV